MNFFWLLTDFCNLNCKYCFYNIWIERRIKDIDFDMIDKYIKFFSRIKAKKIIISGWEVFRKDFYQKTLYTCRKLEEKKILYNIDTNLVYLNWQIVNFLKQAKYLNMLFVSLDSIKQSTNDYLRWKTKNVLENIKILSENKIDFSILLTLTKQNLKDLEDTLNYIKKLSPTEIIIKPVFISKNHIYFNQLMLDETVNYDTVNKLIKKYINYTDLGENLNKFYNLWTHFYNSWNIKESVSCPMWKNFFVVFTDWTVKDCFHTDNIIGNILTDNNNLTDKLKNRSSYMNLPKCFSKQCVSLFSMNECWNEETN